MAGSHCRGGSGMARLGREVRPWLGTGGSVYEIVLRKGLLSKEELDCILHPETLTQPVPLDLYGKSH
ncbi:hypothetical protein CupriaWKF_24740 [Cupriavidus sp. WKF15]|uniref:hypothetical protein n=1 Tax=Cupriavidus sp. WKF15 TaxID=3032282 RepID=UPI0023E1B0B0|nr:hypothetical protein [Cupriavidus sp. WKF15]WER48018.1 hypothetical protein CupriaWKF_24740 [Cupriavidus sp. WKF15]